MKNYTDILNKIIEEPGIVSEAFSQFHDYSIGNVIMVMVQCWEKGIEFGPISNYNNWKRLGRQVQSGQGGMFILHPIQKSFPKDECKVCGQSEHETTDHEFEKVWVKYLTFEAKKTAFVLSQTEGKDIEWAQYGWDKEQALSELGISEIAFAAGNGNAQGYANREGVAINPVAMFPMKTMAHEIAHKLMHIDEGTPEIFDTDHLPYNEHEAEAEMVALIVSEALGLEGREESIGYIRAWAGEGYTYTEKQAQRILGTANKILNAGKVEKKAEEIVEQVGEIRPANQYDPEKFDAQAVVDQVMKYYQIGKHQLDFEVRVKDVNQGHAVYDRRWISIPKWAVRTGQEYAIYYTAHEASHMVHRYHLVHGIPLPNYDQKEMPRREPGSHGPQFKKIEGDVLRDCWGISIEYKKAYPKRLKRYGEVVYDGDKARR